MKYSFMALLAVAFAGVGSAAPVSLRMLTMNQVGIETSADGFMEFGSRIGPGIRR